MKEKGSYKGTSLLSTGNMSNSMKGENKIEGSSNYNFIQLQGLEKEDRSHP